MKRRSLYIKGARIENEARKVLEEAGWMVIRSAGSKGLFDLVAIGGFGTRLIQVKARHATAEERRELEAKAATLPASITIELWERIRPGTFQITHVGDRKRGV